MEKADPEKHKFKAPPHEREDVAPIPALTEPRFSIKEDKVKYICNAAARQVASEAVSTGALEFEETAAQEELLSVAINGNGHAAMPFPVERGSCPFLPPAGIVGPSSLSQAGRLAVMSLRRGLRAM
mmetsp:Transcript_113025/g.352286  ORF Transcript_113025/g.352286 Transcript_113025/m.352286 type:complete len:126 (-) Transcript_113025:13-390(-)